MRIHVIVTILGSLFLSGCVDSLDGTTEQPYLSQNADDLSFENTEKAMERLADFSTRTTKPSDSELAQFNEELEKSTAELNTFMAAMQPALDEQAEMFGAILQQSPIVQHKLGRVLKWTSLIEESGEYEDPETQVLKGIGDNAVAEFTIQTVTQADGGWYFEDVVMELKSGEKFQLIDKTEEP